MKHTHGLAVLFCIFLVACKDNGQITVSSSEDFQTRGLAVSAETIMDGGVGKITVTANYYPKADLTFRLKTTSGTAIAGTHFALIDQNFTIPAGSNSKSIPLVTFFDGGINSRDLTVEISNPSEGSINEASAEITIEPLSIPENEVSGVQNMSTGSSHTCATLSNGKILCWGVNDKYQLGFQVPSLTYSDPISPNTYVPPLRVTGIDSSPVAIQTRDKTTCVRYADERLYCWGDNSYASIQNPAAARVAPPVETSTEASDFSIGYYSMCIVKSDGTLQCRGDNNYGECGDGNPSAITITSFATATAVSGPVSAVAVGRLHACAILQTGALECWGYNAFGETGNGNTLLTTVATPITPTGLGANVVEVSTESDYSCARLSSGTIKCWGYDPILGVVDTPTTVAGMPANIVEISVGQQHACGRTASGEVWCWGSNAYGQLGDGSYSNSAFPVKVATLNEDPAIKISAGVAHTCAVLQSGKPVCWGSNVYNQIGKLNRISYVAPIDVQSYQAQAITGFTMGGHSSNPFGCALKVDGSVECIGSNTVRQLGANTGAAYSYSPLQVSGLGAGAATDFAVGEDFACALLTGTGIQCWGNNASYQIGNGGVGATIDPAETPTGLGSGTKELKSAYKRSCIITSSDTLTCWGYSSSGELGTCASPSIPTAIASTANTTEVGIGAYHNCLVNSTGAVKCWGYNDSGQLGTGVFSSACQPTPQTVTLPEQATQLALGFDFSCALTASGDVYCWGGNSYGQLGIGTYIPEYSDPQRVSGLSGKALQIAAGYQHACALLTTGEVECWGNNFYNQLGKLRQTIASSEDRQPAKVQLLSTGVQKILLGQYTSCAIVSGGYAKCWGADYLGYLRTDLYFPNKPKYIYSP